MFVTNRTYDCLTNLLFGFSVNKETAPGFAPIRMFELHEQTMLSAFHTTE